METSSDWAKSHVPQRRRVAARVCGKTTIKHHLRRRHPFFFSSVVSFYACCSSWDTGAKNNSIIRLELLQETAESLRVLVGITPDLRGIYDVQEGREGSPGRGVQTPSVEPPTRKHHCFFEAPVNSVSRHQTKN